MRQHKTIADITRERFDMDEQEYLRICIRKGMTTRAIGEELGVSNVAVRDRLMFMADYKPGRWVEKLEAA